MINENICRLCISPIPILLFLCFHFLASSAFDVKCATIQFYGNNHNSQSNCWIGLKCYMESPDMLSYLRLKFQINWNLGRHRNTGQQRLYEFCYLLPFDLWTSSLLRLFSYKDVATSFVNFLVLQEYLNGQQHSFHVWYGLRINVESL